MYGRGTVTEMGKIIWGLQSASNGSIPVHIILSSGQLWIPMCWSKSGWAFLPPATPFNSLFFLCHDLQWCRVLLKSVVLFAVIALWERVKIQSVHPQTHSSKSKPKTNSCWRGWWGILLLWPFLLLALGRLLEALWLNFSFRHAMHKAQLSVEIISCVESQITNNMYTLKVNTLITSFHQNLIVKLAGMSKLNQTRHN